MENIFSQHPLRSIYTIFNCDRMTANTYTHKLTNIIPFDVIRNIATTISYRKVYD